jgi:hypothetical protein
MGPVVRRLGDDGASVPGRWMESWASPSGDMEEGSALLSAFGSWDGDDSGISPELHGEFVALDGRLMAYEDWCGSQGFEPRRSDPRYW